MEVPGSSRTDHWQPLKGFFTGTAPTGSLYRPEPVPQTVPPVERPLVEVPGSNRPDHWQPLKGFSTGTAPTGSLYRLEPVKLITSAPTPVVWAELVPAKLITSCQLNRSRLGICLPVVVLRSVKSHDRHRQNCRVQWPLVIKFFRPTDELLDIFLPVKKWL